MPVQIQKITFLKSHKLQQKNLQTNKRNKNNWHIDIFFNTYPSFLYVTAHVTFPETSAVHTCKSASTFPEVTDSFRLQSLQLRRFSFIYRTVAWTIAAIAATFAVHASSSLVAVVWTEFCQDICVRDESTFLLLVVFGVNKSCGFTSVLETG